MRILEATSSAPALPTSRRSFLGQAVGVVLTAILPGGEAASASGPESAVSETMFQAPARSRGATRINVRQSGARGDGVHDDTAAFQRAIDVLPYEGGTVEVPAGSYLIDPIQSVRLRSRMHLQLAPDAKLLAKPNSADKSHVLWALLVDDVEISGGRILGERSRHLGTTGEWGHGIRIMGASRVTVRDMHIFSCWGDGICIGAKTASDGTRVLSNDVVIAGVVSTGNRRQGLSITGSRDVRVHDSEFSHTSGTAPQCGIDIEPGKRDFATNVHIQNCRVHNNAAYGILAFRRSQGVTVKDCTIEDNRSCGVVTVGCITANIIGNRIRNNGSTGLFIKKGTANCYVSQNTFYNNYSRQGSRQRSNFSQKGVTPNVKRDILVANAASDIRVATNYFL